jgi:hypothetical protein
MRRACHSKNYRRRFTCQLPLDRRAERFLKSS